TQTPEKNIPQHDHDILQLCSGKVTNLCTFALWQQLSTCTRQSALLLNQSNMKIISGLLADLMALHKIRRKVETTHT
ncbi:MAG: hypothetical protein ACK559_32095, partial [bacterium]